MLSNPLSPDLRGTLYERIGPDALRSLLERFYRHVAANAHLAEIFPAATIRRCGRARSKSSSRFCRGFWAARLCTISSTDIPGCGRGTCPSRSRRSGHGNG
ncbi:hypothetical protein [Deinococcus sp. KNUC1210]|uniref:hypothetical protein n=1 Tax=Deinococcus sp. KNUC1210 TaxID=2917691 RepID=UPI00351D6980